MEDSESAAASDDERPQSGTESGECRDENVKSRDENVAEYGVKVLPRQEINVPRLWR